MAHKPPQQPAYSAPTNSSHRVVNSMPSLRCRRWAGSPLSEKLEISGGAAVATEDVEIEVEDEEGYLDEDE
jgi:hypothetical protein